MDGSLRDEEMGSRVKAGVGVREVEELEVALGLLGGLWSSSSSRVRSSV